MTRAHTSDVNPMEGLSAGDWRFVQSLLRDLQAEEHREQIAYVFGQWVLSVSAFRRVESARMVAEVPTELDLLFHKALVADLISVGTMLIIATRAHDKGRLAGRGVRPGVIMAMVQDLHNSFDEWHGQVPEARLEALRDTIFHAAPELHLQDSRA